MAAIPQSTMQSNEAKRSAAYASIGSGVVGIVGSIASLQAASMQARQFKIQSQFLDLQANQEKLKARENAVFLRKKFMQNIASANASFAARGVSTGSGIGRQYTIESLKTLNQDLQANELNSEAGQNALALQSAQARMNEKTTRNLGLLNLASQSYKPTQSLLTGYKTLKELKDG